MSTEHRGSAAETLPTPGHRVLGITVPTAALVALVPGSIWWMANVAFYVLGRLDTGEVGYRAWLSGISGFPLWFQSLFGYASPPSWVLALVVLGAAAATSGRAILRPIALGLATLTVVAVVVVVAGTAIWPDATA